MAKEAYYFSHDSNASRDPKIMQMRSVYKAEGYGWYWMLVEQMREQDNYMLPLSGKYAVNAYASQMDANAERLQQFISDCVNDFRLFEQDANFLWSASLLRRMKKMNDKSEKARQSAHERWAKSNVKQATAMRTHSDRNANAMQLKERKGKEIKGKATPTPSKENNVFQLFEDSFGQMLTPMLGDELQLLEKEYSYEWIADAFKESVKNGVRNLKYAEKILKRWQLDGKDSGTSVNSNNSESKVLTAEEWFAAEKADRTKRGLKTYDL